jgi:hypothetical protein
MYRSFAVSAEIPSSTTFCHAAFFALPCLHVNYVPAMYKLQYTKVISNLEVKGAWCLCLGDVLSVRDLVQSYSGCISMCRVRSLAL